MTEVEGEEKGKGRNGDSRSDDIKRAVNHHYDRERRPVNQNPSINRALSTARAESDHEANQGLVHGRMDIDFE